MSEKMTVNGIEMVEVLKIPRNWSFEMKVAKRVMRENKIPHRSKMWYTFGGWHRYYYVPKSHLPAARRLLKAELWHENRREWFPTSK